MRLYAHTNQQSAALRQYAVCHELLEKEFGAAPSDITTALYEQIRSGQLDQRHELPGLQSGPQAKIALSTGTHFLLAGRYEILDQAEDLVGQGSMGHVFKGQDQQTGQVVAIKALRGRYMGR